MLLQIEAHMHTLKKEKHKDIVVFVVAVELYQPKC